ncbi:hypothetical protein A2U94_07660 [Bacillus sp. VT 712]|uniref:Uncharacterized protein n=1 Tax=Priestia veravalensis TaxID=1414648 RepID=A0A0V8JPJ3_9BACI|nr:MULTISPECIES: hypothetical protein [Bacillaceae]KSU88922.1 hypothetical protein AS180_05340 [Priestia veravalensis]KZB92159.1 hypothetical protein A2U94_07660 [Bacillus sp. VT 712]SCC03107.1 hypothetical protein GA0061087_100858 [Priestia flexa]
MSSVWMYNNNVNTAIVTVDENEYLVYYKTVSSLIPKLVEEIQTGKRITYKDVSEEISSIPNNMNLDEMTRYMISRLQTM